MRFILLASSDTGGLDPLALCCCLPPLGKAWSFRTKMQNEEKKDEKDFELVIAGFHYASDNSRRGLIATAVPM
jgi:hypothetical protein